MLLPTTIVAYAYGNKGEQERAIRDLTKAIEIKPDYVDAYNNRGNVYNNKGRYDSAIVRLYQSNRT